MTHEKNQAKALLEIWTVFVRYRWRFILPTFVVAATVLVVGLILPRKYQAEAIFDHSTDMVLAEITQKGAPRSFQEPKQAIVEELAGKPAIEDLRQSLEPILNDPNSGVSATDRDFYRELGLRIVVRKTYSSRDHDRYKLEYVGNDPVRARLVVNTLVENYIERTRAAMEERLNKSATFFNQRVGEFRDTIERLESDRLEFEIENDILLPDAANGIQTQITDQQQILAGLMERRETALQTVQSLEAELAQTPKIVPIIKRGPNPRKQQMADKLNEVEQKLSHAIDTLKMTANHPDLIALQQQAAGLRQTVASMEDEIITSREEGPNPKRADLEVKLANSRAAASALDSQAIALKKNFEQLELKSGRLFPVRADYRKMVREIELAQKELNFWQDNLRRVNMAVAAESGNRGVQLDFVKPCGKLSHPVSPNVYQVFAAAAMLGVFAGALSVFFAYRTDETFTDGDQLARAVNLPMIGCVSEIISGHQRRLRRVRQMIVCPIQGAAMSITLVVLAGLLYTNLEKPQLFDEWTSIPQRLFNPTAGPQTPTPNAVTAPAEHLPNESMVRKAIEGEPGSTSRQPQANTIRLHSPLDTDRRAPDALALDHNAATSAKESN